jgi:hypothetical protein
LLKQEYSPILHSYVPPTYPFYAPSTRIGVTPHFYLNRSSLLLLGHCVPSHLASGLTFIYSPSGSNRLATLKHLNKPKAPLVALALFVTLCSYSSLRSSHLAQTHYSFDSPKGSNILATLNHLNKHRPRSFHSLNVLFASVLFLGLLLLCSILGPPLSTQALL